MPATSAAEICSCSEAQCQRMERMGEVEEDNRITDRNSGLHLTILSSVTVIRDDSRDAADRSTAHRGDHEEEFHEVVIDSRRAGGLDEIHVLPSDVLVHLNPDLSIGETFDTDVPERDTELVRDVLR